MSSNRNVNFPALNERARKILEQYHGGYVIVKGGEVLQFVDGDLQPVDLPSDVKDELVRATPADGSYWVRSPGQASNPVPPKPQRADFPGDEVGYFRAAAAHHEAVNGPSQPALAST